MLCRPDIGLAAIAPRVCRLAREIVGAEAASLFWLDRNAMPLGFFHEDSPDEARDLFTNEFERLFVGPDEINVFALAQGDGAMCGQLMRPPTSYFQSNTYNLLIRPSGHHHSLDLRIDDASGGHAVLLLFRGEYPAFTDQDAATLMQFEPLLRRAGTAEGAATWRSDTTRWGHVLVDPRDGAILALSGAAEEMLRESSLVGQRLARGGPLDVAPRFLVDLCEPALRSGRAVASIAISAGRLNIEATVMYAPSGQTTSVQVLMTLRHETPADIALIDPVLARRLSPLRSEILMFAACGGTRDAVSRAFDISKEAAKKHVAEIYRVMDVGRWDDIPRALQAGS